MATRPPVDPSVFRAGIIHPGDPGTEGPTISKDVQAARVYAQGFANPKVQSSLTDKHALPKIFATFDSIRVVSHADSVVAHRQVDAELCARRDACQAAWGAAATAQETFEKGRGAAEAAGGEALKAFVRDAKAKDAARKSAFTAHEAAQDKYAKHHAKSELIIARDKAALEKEIQSICTEQTKLTTKALGGDKKAQKRLAELEAALDALLPRVRFHIEHQALAAGQQDQDTMEHSAAASKVSGGAVSVTAGARPSSPVHPPKMPPPAPPSGETGGRASRIPSTIPAPVEEESRITQIPLPPALAGLAEGKIKDKVRQLYHPTMTAEAAVELMGRAALVGADSSAVLIGITNAKPDEAPYRLYFVGKDHRPDSVAVRVVTPPPDVHEQIYQNVPTGTLFWHVDPSAEDPEPFRSPMTLETNLGVLGLPFSRCHAPRLEKLAVTDVTFIAIQFSTSQLAEVTRESQGWRVQQLSGLSEAILDGVLGNLSDADLANLRSLTATKLAELSAPQAPALVLAEDHIYGNVPRAAGPSVAATELLYDAVDFVTPRLENLAWKIDALMEQRATEARVRVLDGLVTQLNDLAKSDPGKLIALAAQLARPEFSPEDQAYVLRSLSPAALGALATMTNGLGEQGASQPLYGNLSSASEMDALRALEERAAVLICGRLNEGGKWASYGRPDILHYPELNPEVAFKLLRESSGSRADEPKAIAAKFRAANRYTDIIPTDAQVRMMRDRGIIPPDGYINACITRVNDDSAKSVKSIASQGPLGEQQEQFWKMVLAANVGVINMTTSLVEGGKSKCIQYWPPDPAAGQDLTGSQESFGNITVQHLAEPIVRVVTVRNDDGSSTSTNSWITRKLRVTDNTDPANPVVRDVIQQHYVAWPDHGIPDNALIPDLLAMVRENRRLKAEGGCPSVDHCSAGVGRTGVIETLEALMDQVEATGRPVTRKDVIDTIRRLRWDARESTGRDHLVQVWGQLDLLFRIVDAWPDLSEAAVASRPLAAPA